MKEYPVLMSAPMVRATLSGTKTQTRRIVIPTQSRPKITPLTMEPWMIDGEQQEDDDGRPCWAGSHPGYPTGEKWFSCPYGGVGDRLWVREKYAEWQGTSDLVRLGEFDGDPLEWIHYAATCDGWDGIQEDARNGHPWDIRPSIHMPRWACRLVLEIVGIRVERLQSITEEDAIAEGCVSTAAGNGYSFAMPARMNFVDLWDGMYAKRGYGWAEDPWVWVVGYRRLLS